MIQMRRRVLLLYLGCMSINTVGAKFEIVQAESMVVFLSQSAHAADPAFSHALVNA